jgi:uncharacterized protein GlcG (DUF336 family)
MPHFPRIVIAAIVAAAATPAAAQLSQKTLSLDTALVIANEAAAACKAQGFPVSIAIVGRDGSIVAHLKGDNTSPHTMENCFRKAYTALTYRAKSGALAERLEKEPNFAGVQLPNITWAKGGVPVTIGEDIIGAVGVSGAKGGQIDEACAEAGIAKAAELLK